MYNYLGHQIYFKQGNQIDKRDAAVYNYLRPLGSLFFFRKKKVFRCGLGSVVSNFRSIYLFVWLECVTQIKRHKTSEKSPASYSHHVDLKKLNHKMQCFINKLISRLVFNMIFRIFTVLCIILP